MGPKTQDWWITSQTYTHCTIPSLAFIMKLYCVSVYRLIMCPYLHLYRL